MTETFLRDALPVPLMANPSNVKRQALSCWRTERALRGDSSSTAAEVERSIFEKKSLSELLVTYEDGVIADLDDLRSTRREAAAWIPSGSAAKCRAGSFPAGSSA